MQNPKMSDLPPGTLIAGTLRAQDVHEYAQDLSSLWDVRLIQLKRSLSDFHCRYVTDGCAMLYEETYGAAATVRGALRGENICFGLSNSTGRDGRWKGRSLPEHALAYTHGEREVDVFFPHDTNNIMVILPREAFARRLQQLCGRAVEDVFPPAGIHVTLSPPALDELKSLLRRLLASTAPAPAPNLQQVLTDAIIEACCTGFKGCDNGSPAAWHHFRKALGRLNDGTLPCRLSDLAADLGLTLRSVETAFRQCAGMSPAGYLHHVRLNHARDALLALGPDDTTVTEVAVQHGFTELGRFAGEYRQVFGELPSETLRSRYRRARVGIPCVR